MPRATWEDLQFGVDILPGQPRGLLAPGTVDLASRPVVHNPDGTISTVRSMSIGTEQGEVLIPTIGQKGEVYTPEQAIEAYKTTGYHLGIFNSPGAADLYAEQLHANQANEYADPVEQPSLADTYDASARLVNTGTNLYELATRDAAPAAQVGYNALTTPGELAEFEEDAEAQHLVMRSRSAGETRQILERYRTRNEQITTIQRAGWKGVAMMFANGVVFDPVTLMAILTPATGFAAKAEAASRVSRVFRGVAAQAVFDTASETILHANQESRTLNESLSNIGMSALFGGAMGAFATRIPKAEYIKLQEKAEAELKRLDPETHPPTSSTVGAAQAGHNTTIDDEGIAHGGALVAATVGRANPLARTLTSATKAARVLVQKIGDVPFLLGKNLKGVATQLGVEAISTTRIRRAYAETVLNATNAYQAYLRTKPAQALTWDEFKMAVSKSMREEDAHAVAQVQDVARATRKIFDAHRAELVALKVQPEDLHLVGAASYFPRVYNHAAIRANRAAFEDVLRQWFRHNPVPTKVLRQIEKEGRMVDETVERMVPREPAEVEAAVQDAMDNILGSNGVNVGRNTGTPKALKSRELDVPDKLLEPYLVNDYELVMAGYLHSMVPQIEMRKMFGDVNIEPELQKVRDEYHVLISNTTNNQLKRELEKQMSQVQEDIRGIHARTLGQTRGNMEPEALVRTSRIIRNANYPRTLGMMLLSSFSDYGHVMTRYGATKTIGTTIKFLANSNLRKLTRQQADLFGAAQDLLRDTRASTMGDLSADVPTGGRIDTALHRLSAKFTKYSGMSHWNTGIKFLSMAMEQDAVIKAIKNGSSMSKYKRGLLAQMGIDDNMLGRISKEAEHFQNDGGIWRMRTEAWKDQDAAKVMEAAMIRAGDIMTITRGAGDTPLLMDKSLVKMLLQFKGFGITAVNRIMIPVAQGIAHGDANTIFGAGFMLTLGMLSYATKEYAAGREPDLSPDTLVMQSLNWSGLLGYIPDMWDPLSGGVFGTPRFSKFSDQQPIETLLGPTLGFASDVYNVVKNDKNEWGITQKDIHAARKIFPMQNLFYLRRIIDGLEGETAEAIGAPDATHSTLGNRLTSMTAAPASKPTDWTSIGTGVGVAALAIAFGMKNAKQLQALALGGRVPKNAVEEGAMAAKGWSGEVSELTSPPGKLASDFTNAQHYNEVYTVLDNILNKQPYGLAQVPMKDFVKALDKTIAPDSEFRELVDKLLKADLPGTISFGKQGHMTKAVEKTSNPTEFAKGAGVYFPKSNAHPKMPGEGNILINLDRNSADELAGTAMHELTHALTHAKLRQGGDFANSLSPIFAEARDVMGMPKHYAFANLDEFLSESFGNLEFRNLLKEHGIWDKLVKTIGTTLGMSAAGLVALDTVMSASPDQEQPTA